jgi:aryl sulfotransferase
MRAFLTSLMGNGDDVDINALAGLGSADRAIYDDALELETSDLLPEELARLRATAYRVALDGMTDVAVVKMHDAWLPFPGTNALPFPEDRIRSLILLVRDPRDVAVSLAHHNGVTIDAAIARMEDSQYCIGRTESGLNVQLDQYLSDWSRHTLSWLDSGLRPLVVRYEDLLASPLRVFGTIARTIGVQRSEAVVRKSIAACCFERLQAGESRDGFGESCRVSSDRFFRAGKAGAWRHRLTARQAQRITRNHDRVMRLLGYTPEH